MTAQEQNLEIRLSLSRDAFHLEVDLRLPSSGITVLFGPSGSGKTTMLRCLAGLDQADGRVVIGGQIWQDTGKRIHLPTWQRDLGYVFQESSLFEHLDVQRNLNYGIDRIKKPGLAESLDQAIDLLGIRHLLSRPVDGLSGGERQRVAIARALAMQPKLLLLDEPLASLDQNRKQEILPWLEGLHRGLSIPIIYVTHSRDELARLADHLVILEDGHVRASGPAGTLMQTLGLRSETVLKIAFSTIDSVEKAQQLSHQIVALNLAACVNIIPGITSIYRWDGEIQSGTECLMMMKTTPSGFEQLKAWLPTQHPYNCPELISVDISDGLAPYLRWLHDSNTTS